MVDESTTAGAPVGTEQPVQALNPPSVPLNTRSEDLVSGVQEKEIIPTTTQKIGAVLGLTSDKSAFGIPFPGLADESPGALLRARAESLANDEAQQKGVARISPDEANKRFPGMPVSFNEPVNPFVAELQYNSQKHREKMQEWASRGTPLPWGVETAVGIAGGVFDPVNLMSMYLTGGASKALGLSRTVLSTFGENLAINAATGVISYKQEKQEHQDVSLSDAAQQAVFGAVGGTALHYAAGAVFRALNGAADHIRRTPKDIQEQNLKSAMAQHESGSVIDITPSNIEVSSRARGDMEGQRSQYRFTPSEHPSDRPYYAAQGSDGIPADYLNLGPGIQAVDDGMVANNRISVEGGKVAQMDVPPDAKMLDIEQPASSMDQKFIQELEKKSDIKIDIQQGESIKDVLSRLGQMAESGDAPHDILSQVQDLAKTEGYSGYKYVLGDEASGTQKNGIHLFDENHQPTDISIGDPALTPTRSGSDIEAQNQRMNDPAASKYHTAETEKAIHDYKHESSLNSTPDYMDPIIKEQYESTLAMLDEMAKENPELKEELRESLDHGMAIDKQESSVVEKLANCFGGNP